MKLFKNKFFIICLCIAIVLAVGGSTFSLMGYRAMVRDVIGTVTVPFRWVGSLFADAGEGFRRYFTSIRAIEAEKERLEAENEALRDEMERAGYVERENEKLRDYLGMKNKHPDFKFENATVIGRESSNYMTVITLNRGTVHGITRNMPVVTANGIVGCVTEVGLTWCKVSTILETASSVGAYLPATEATGIISGDYSMRTDGLCKLSYISPADAEIAVGDTVESSGTGSVYPAGLRIGTVEAVEFDAPSRSVVAKVRPVVDFSDLRNVMIITGYEK